MGEQQPRIRLHVDADLIPGARVRLDERQAHYLGNVMRLGVGAVLRVFNGHDGEWRVTITELGKKGGECVADGCLRPQVDEPGPWLLFSPLKKTTTDFVVEKATELGAVMLWPVITRRTVGARVNLDRMCANATEASEQCERLTVPEVRAATPLDRVLACWPAERTLFYLDETGEGGPLTEAIRRLDGDDIGFLVGPEGGWDQSDLDALAAMPNAVPVGLGPRILRAETAAASALAVWQAFKGDWNQPPKARRRL